MVVWALEILVAVSLAIATTWVSWRTPLGLVGVALILCVALTTASFFSYDFGTRVLFEVIQAAMLCHTARIAFAVDRRWPAIAIVVLSVLDLAWCAVQPLIPAEGVSRGYWFGAVTNIIFAATCFCVAYPGMRDAYRARRRRRDPDGMVGDGALTMDALFEKVRKL